MFVIDECDYWSGESSVDCAYTFYVIHDEAAMSNDSRHCGQPVRAVQ